VEAFKNIMKIKTKFDKKKIKKNLMIRNEIEKIKIKKNKKTK